MENNRGVRGRARDEEPNKARVPSQSRRGSGLAGAPGCPLQMVLSLGGVQGASGSSEDLLLTVHEYLGHLRTSSYVHEYLVCVWIWSTLH